MSVPERRRHARDQRAGRGGVRRAAMPSSARALAILTRVRDRDASASVPPSPAREPESSDAIAVVNTSATVCGVPNLMSVGDVASTRRSAECRCRNPTPAASRRMPRAKYSSAMFVVSRRTRLVHAAAIAWFAAVAHALQLAEVDVTVPLSSWIAALVEPRRSARTSSSSTTRRRADRRTARCSPVPFVLSPPVAWRQRCSAPMRQRVRAFRRCRGRTGR